MAVQRHAGLQPQRIAGAEPGGHHAQRPAQFHQHLPHARGDAGAEAQLEAVLARVAGAADDAALALGGRVEDARPAPRGSIASTARSTSTSGCNSSTDRGPWMANMAQSRLTSVQMISWPGRSARSRGQMGADPIDDLRPVAGVDHQEEERLAVGVVVIADQHVVENSALRRW